MRQYIGGIFLIFVGFSVFGQKAQKITLEPLHQGIIDADLTEWPLLINVADESLWYYQIGKDNTYIYMALRVKDPLLQQLAVWNGIVFSVVSAKKDKPDMQFVFPFPDAEVKRAIRNEDTAASKDARQELIERSRGYYVQGFSGIPSGILSLQNSYGFHAKVDLVGDALVYEARIPKTSLPQHGKPLVLKIGVNDGISFLQVPRNRPMQPQSNYGYGYARPSSATKAKSKQTRVVLLETTIH